MLNLVNIDNCCLKLGILGLEILYLIPNFIKTIIKIAETEVIEKLDINIAIFTFIRGLILIILQYFLTILAVFVILGVKFLKIRLLFVFAIKLQIFIHKYFFNKNCHFEIIANEDDFLS